MEGLSPIPQDQSKAKPKPKYCSHMFGASDQVVKEKPNSSFDVYSSCQPDRVITDEIRLDLWH